MRAENSESSCLVSPGVVFLASEDEVTAEYKRQNDGSEIIFIFYFYKTAAVMLK